MRKEEIIERAKGMLLKGEFLHDGDIYTPKDINETIERLLPLIEEACDACVEEAKEAVARSRTHSETHGIGARETEARMQAVVALQALQEPNN